MNAFDNIREWSRSKQLDKANSLIQCVKLMEEVGELAEGLCKDRPEQVLDSIGDAVVVLTILAQQQQALIEHCIDGAWEEIKNRRGITVNGRFIKSEDLPKGKQGKEHD